MANPITFASMPTEPAPRPAQPPVLPLPANAQARTSSALEGFLAALPRNVKGMQQFRLDGDLAMALDDQWQASGEPWAVWLEKAVNEALRNWLGR